MIQHEFEPEPFKRDACDRKFDDNGRAGYCGRPKAEHLAAPVETKPREPGCQCHKEEGDSPCPVHGEEKPTVFPKKWPRKVGWKKLQERKAKCNHAIGGAVVVTFYPSDCPRCLADEVAYWKARSRSAEGNAARETVRADNLALQVAALTKELTKAVDEDLAKAREERDLFQLCAKNEKENAAKEREGRDAEWRAVVKADRDALAAALAVLNTPELRDFAKGVVLEAAHQRERWGTDHDGGKEPSDWFWLVGYLAGKALHCHAEDRHTKALHHTITAAAALANWHAAILGKTNMRPGIEPPAPAAGLVTCEHCPDHPHPLNDDGTKCKFPKPAPAQAEELPL